MVTNYLICLIAIKRATLFHYSGLIAEGSRCFVWEVNWQPDPNSIQVQVFTEAWLRVYENKYMYGLYGSSFIWSSTRADGNQIDLEHWLSASWNVSDNQPNHTQNSMKCQKWRVRLWIFSRRLKSPCFRACLTSPARWLTLLWFR